LQDKLGFGEKTLGHTINFGHSISLKLFLLTHSHFAHAVSGQQLVIFHSQSKSPRQMSLVEFLKIMMEKAAMKRIGKIKK
jgi:hypothetical protein